MRIDVFDDDMISIFVNNNYFKKSIFDSKEDVVGAVKNLLIKYKNKLKLVGFYKVKVFVHEKVGLFINIIKLDNNYNDIVDFKIIVNYVDKIYFKTSIYDILPNDIEILYFDNNYYCNVEDIVNITDVVEFGEYVYGDLLISVLDKALFI